LENLSSEDKQKFKINSGVKITKIENPRLAQFEKELTGAVILKINNIPITDMEQVNKLVGGKDESEGIQLEIMTNSGQLVRIII
jgi:S1-C subfamily serine protease